MIKEECETEVRCKFYFLLFNHLMFYWTSICILDFNVVYTNCTMWNKLGSFGNEIEWINSFCCIFLVATMVYLVYGFLCCVCHDLNSSSPNLLQKFGY